MTDTPTLDECIAWMEHEAARARFGRHSNGFKAAIAHLRAIPTLTARAEAAEAERDRLRKDGQFLVDRLADFEPEYHDAPRMYGGLVEPAIERFRAALAAADLAGLADGTRVVVPAPTTRRATQLYKIVREFHASALNLGHYAGMFYARGLQDAAASAREAQRAVERMERILSDIKPSALSTCPGAKEDDDAA